MLLTVGSSGGDVVRVQQFLADPSRKLYTGAIDGHYGSGTKAAVAAFQSSAGLIADGIVGPGTWGAMFPSPAAPSGEAPSVSSVAGQPLAWRCLALTGSIETGLPVPGCFSGLSGNFDGQGISFGAIQWALGQGSLQPLFQDMCSRHGDVVQRVFAGNAATFRTTFTQSDRAAQMAWALGIQSGNQVQEPWRSQMKALGATPECQALQVSMARARYDSGLALCRNYGVVSERAAALMFDIMVQDGGISSTTRAQIESDFAALGTVADETPKLEIIARRRAAACNPKWRQDVLSRKMMIAQGQGTVHGTRYDLAAQYAITLNHAEGLQTGGDTCPPPVATRIVGGGSGNG